MFHYRGKYSKFAVLFCGNGVLRALTVCNTRSGAVVSSFFSVEFQEDQQGKAMQTAMKKMGLGRECVTIISGNLPESFFLRFRTGALTGKNLRGAIELELSGRLLKEPGSLFQFSVPERKKEDKHVWSNVYVMVPSSIRKLELFLMHGLHTADFFIYPLMGIEEQDPAVYIPEMEPDFYFSNGEWQPVSTLSENWLDAWKNRIGNAFALPEKFEFEKFLPALLVARFVLSNTFSENLYGLAVLPKKYRTGRYRTQLVIMFFLVLFLLLNWGRKCFLELNRDRTQLLALRSEESSLIRRIRNGKSKLKSSEKEIRDLSRVINLSAGESGLVHKLAALSKVLPKNVMIVSFRLSESGIDLMMRSEAENLNLQNLINPLQIWKVSSVRQFRRGNEAASTVTAKLIPLEMEGKEK